MNNDLKAECLELLKHRHSSGQIDRRSFLTGLVMLGVLPAPWRAGGAGSRWPACRHQLGRRCHCRFRGGVDRQLRGKEGVTVKIDGSGPTRVR